MTTPRDLAAASLAALAPVVNSVASPAASLAWRRPGALAAAAAALHVHRTTLYYRLARIRELIGTEVRTGEVGTALQLALWLDVYRRAGQP